MLRIICGIMIYWTPQMIFKRDILDSLEQDSRFKCCVSYLHLLHSICFSLHSAYDPLVSERNCSTPAIIKCRFSVYYDWRAIIFVD
jgi:hypothetical protein